MYESQKVSSLHLSFGAVASLYVKGNRMIAVGARYRFPLYTRWTRSIGDDLNVTRGLSTLNDLTVFAHLGYYWGFVFAEYRFADLYESPLQSPSQLTAGVRFNIPFEW
ncbi:MAG: hypothetical protein DCO96_14660 [Fluviicola sp. XM-24bin1]|nr:MAG: hypothetical protein DCO96_14660 [Fluviicola sp. XM-24bin1]